MQRKVFTTPVRNEANDFGVTYILPSGRSLNKERGGAAVSIGEKCQRSNRRSQPEDSPRESGPCVKTMLSVLGDVIAKFSNPVVIVMVQFVMVTRSNGKFGH